MIHWIMCRRFAILKGRLLFAFYEDNHLYAKQIRGELGSSIPEQVVQQAGSENESGNP